MSAGSGQGGQPGPQGWVSTTHDWSSSVDVRHLDEIRRQPHVFAPGGAVRRDAEGRAVRKPVMATEDLRFFDDPSAERLPSSAGT